VRLEPFAVLFGIAAVWLAVEERVWAWPTSLVQVLLYSVVFFRERLYAQAALQLAYAAIAVYGWVHWTRGGAGRAPLRVTRTPSVERVLLPLLGAALAAALGGLLARYTDAAVPWLDAALMAGSLCAQYMMSRKYLGNWTLWIVLDVVYVTLFVTRGLLLTAFLYAAFLALSARGAVTWRRSWKAAHGAPSRG
jgi:nicotinamide mononucleotide transporter